MAAIGCACYQLGVASLVAVQHSVCNLLRSLFHALHVAQLGTLFDPQKQHTMRAKKDYFSILHKFISWRADHEIDKDYVITLNELKEVIEKDVEEYFNVCAYGTNSLTDDDRPTECRSSSLQYWKKAISYFMPN